MVDFSGEESKNQEGIIQIPEINPIAENKEHSNSVDAITANPKKENEYASGSHDRSIKTWDANTGKCIKTLTGHNNGVWCLNYSSDGKKLLSSSSDGSAKLWDASNGKCSLTLDNKNESRMYYATLSQDMTMAATVGSDRLVCVWDLRNAKSPLIKNNESKSCIMSCDWSVDQKYVISSTMEGEVNALDLQTRKMRVEYNTLVNQPQAKSNICYCVKSVANHPAGGNKFLLGSELAVVTVVDLDPSYDEPLQRLETQGKYVGHSNSIRHVDATKDYSHLLTSCADGSLRIWSNETFEATSILCGHTDLVSAGAWLNNHTVVSSSWDGRILTWRV